jgi:hypothetical protein
MFNQYNEQDIEAQLNIKDVFDPKVAFKWSQSISFSIN